jgi:hypothetical protein
MTNARQSEMRILPDDILGGITDDELSLNLPGLETALH